MMRAILIVCVPRTGSSALAGALHEAGLSMGSNLIGPHPEWNQKGHYEMRDWWRIAVNVQDRVSCGLPPFDDDLRAMAHLISTRTEQPIWGLKSPFLGYSLPYILPYLPNDLRLVVMHRRFESVVASQMRHSDNGNGITQAQAERRVSIQLGYMFATLVSVDHLPQYHVQFETLIDQPEATLTGVLEFCYDGIQDVTPQEIATATQFIEPRLKRW